MNKVNPYFLHCLLDPITGMADDDEAVIKYRHVDLNDEQQARKIIREFMVPHAKAMTGDFREKTQLAYRYYLTRSDSRWDRVFDSILPPFVSPKNYRQFFEWLYEECFQTTDYLLSNIDEYVVVEDVNEPMAAFRRSKGKA